MFDITGIDSNGFVGYDSAEVLVRTGKKIPGGVII